MVKKILVLLTALFAIVFHSKAISFTNSTPISGSEITSFDFVLNFDISDVINEKGDGEWGIYVASTYRDGVKIEYDARLYKGDADSGELLGRALTSTITGKSENFQVGNFVSFSFPGLSPEVGQTYTIKIDCQFNAMLKGSTTAAGANHLLNCRNNPIILTFIGAASNSENLELRSSNIVNGSSMDNLNLIQLSFNQPITITDNFSCGISDNSGKLYSSSSYKIDENDENTLIINFDNLKLLNSHTYQFSLDAGSVSSASNKSVVNDEFSITFNGTGFIPFEISHITPNSGFIGIVSAVTVDFNLNNGVKFPEYFGSSKRNYPATIFIKQDDEFVYLASIQGIPSESENSLTWNIDCGLSPEMEYLFKVEKGDLTALKEDVTAMSGYRAVTDMANDEINISFTTPSIENSGLPKIEFSVPYKSDTNGYNRVEFPDNTKTDFIPILYIDLKDRYYQYNGSSFELLHNPEITTAALYKLSEGGEKIKIKDCDLGTMIFYTAESRFKSIALNVNSRLYQGETYQIVIPASAFTVNSTPLQSYISSDEIVLTYEGASESNLSLSCSSLRDGERMSSISSVTFLSDQELALVRSWDNITLQTADGEVVTTSSYMIAPVSYMIKQDTGHTLEQIFTRIMVDFSDPRTMTPFSLPLDADEYKIIIPAGTFCLANDPDIQNEEIIVNIKRVPETGLPEYVTLTSVVNAYASTILPIEKGLKAKLQLTPSEDWAIEKVIYNGKDVTDNVAEDGSYETPAVRIDSRMEVHLAYNGDLFFENATGIVEIPDMKIRAFSDGEHIVIEGVSSGDVVTVYTMAGVSLGAHTATDDIVKITAPKGNIYIVSITPSNGENKAAVKINH